MKTWILGFLFTTHLWAVTPFQLPWMNHPQPGTVFRSQDYKGGIFVVEAYFLGCPYCNDNAPNVNALADRFSGDSRVQVLDVGVDRSDSQYAEWIRRHRPNHPVLKDASRDLIRQLGPSGYPSTYVLDCKGQVRYSTFGVWAPTTIEKLEATIFNLLQEECLN